MQQAGDQPAAERAAQLSFALYAAANRMVRLHKPILDPLGLTFPQYLVLMELYAEAPRTVGDIGSRVAMDAGTITPVLKRLEAAGKVTRMRDPKDERRVLVSLTAAGEALRETILSVTDQVESACEAPDLDLDHLRQQLDQLAHPRPARKPAIQASPEGPATRTSRKQA